MPTLALPNMTGFSVALPSRGYKAFSKNEDGTGVIAGLKIFRAGTFKDSMGYQRTWEVEHLEQMIFHFNLLRNRGIFPNVPVRDGHPGIFGSGGEVIGYLENLRRETEDETDFLVSDLGITEPEAYAKWERGTFRARSLEVGMYETNDEATYYPVVMGLAFVDIPAVEGLYAKQSHRPERSPFHFAQVLVDETKENTVAGEQTTPAGTQTPAPPAAPANATGAPAAPGAEGAPAAPAASAPAPVEQSGGQAPAAESQQGGQGQAAQPPADGGQAQHGQTPPAMTFKINGQPTADFAAVQRHIDALEGASKEAADQARKDFVTGLAQANKIAATQIDDLQAHALSLNDDQFAHFKASYEKAPVVPLFAKHGQTDGGQPTPAGGAADAKADEIEVLKEQVAQHRRRGMSEDKIANLPSYKKLMALTGQTA